MPVGFVVVVVVVLVATAAAVVVVAFFVVGSVHNLKAQVYQTVHCCVDYYYFVFCFLGQ